MKLTFLQTAVFIDDWSALKFGDNELRSLEIQYPETGKVIAQSGGVRKIRFASARRGKSGSVRVIYLHLPAYQRICLLLAFGKNEQANLSPADKEFCRKMVAKIKQELTKGQS